MESIKEQVNRGTEQNKVIVKFSVIIKLWNLTLDFELLHEVPQATIGQKDRYSSLEPLVCFGEEYQEKAPDCLP